MAKFNLNSLLSGASLNSGEDGGEKKNSTLKIVSISVYDLIPSKDNFYSVEDIAELKDSIEMFGVKQNLTVKQLENGKYMVIAGHRRRLALLALVEEGKKEFEFVPCGIETELDEIKEQLLLITTNATARQLTDWEKTQQAEKMRELLERYRKKEKLQGRMRELIAKALKTSPTQIGRMDSISRKLSDEFKEEFKEQNINISTAYEISTLPEGVQQEVFQGYIEKGSISIKDVEKKKEEVNIKPKEVKEVIEDIEKPRKEAEEKEIKTRLGQEKEKIEQLHVYPSVHEVLKEMSISELAEFICSRCDCIGRFCDFAIECNQSSISERNEICVKWLKMETQNRK